MPIPRTPLAVRFLSKFKQGSNSECWNWTDSPRARGGYGAIGEGGKYGKQIRAHRFAFAYFKGIDPGNLLVCHKCDNRICVNPHHLFLGTHKDNSQDMVKKGRCRSGSAGGEQASRAKITAIQARAIFSDTRPQKAVAKDYGLCPASVYNIKSGKTWKHIKKGNT